MSDGKPDYGLETRTVHAEARPDPVTGARATPIYQTTSYVFDDVNHAASLFNLQTFGYIYSRLTNPTVAVLEEKVANLDDGRAAVACASGHAAQFLAFFTLLEPDDHIVASKFLYGGSVNQFTKSFGKLGWHADLIDSNDTGLVEATIRPNTKAIFVEALANPGGVIVDLDRWRRSPGTTPSRSSSTTPWQRPGCTGRSTGVRISSPTRRPSSSAGTTRRWAGLWSSPASSTGMAAGSFPE